MSGGDVFTTCTRSFDSEYDTVATTQDPSVYDEYESHHDPFKMT